MSEDITKTYITLSNGAMVSHYRINKKIGAGGMGEVYLTQDTKLELELSLDILEHLLSIPCEVSAHFLKIDPTFNNLRDHPLFKRLLSKNLLSEN